MANRRASSVVFGFDFQVNAAIILMKTLVILSPFVWKAITKTSI